MWFALPFIVKDLHPLLLPVSRRTSVLSVRNLTGPSGRTAGAGRGVGPRPRRFHPPTSGRGLAARFARFRTEITEEDGDHGEEERRDQRDRLAVWRG